MLPQELKPGDRLEAGWLDRLVREAVARTLSVGPGLRLTRTPAGTNLSLAPRGGAAGAARGRAPWEVWLEDEVSGGRRTGRQLLRMAPGRVCLLGSPAGCDGGQGSLAGTHVAAEGQVVHCTVDARDLGGNVSGRGVAVGVSQGAPPIPQPGWFVFSVAEVARAANTGTLVVVQHASGLVAVPCVVPEEL